MLTRTPEYILSETFNSRIVEQLKDWGYTVLPTRDYEPAGRYRGPSVESSNGYTVMPDILSWGFEHPGGAWVEGKYKTTRWFYRRYDRQEHGINLDTWHHYIDIRVRTQHPVFLFVAEGDTGLIVGAEVNTLRSSGHHDGAINEKPMINFPVAAFQVVGRWVMSEVDAGTLSVSLERSQIRDMFDDEGIMPVFQKSLF